MENIAKLDAIFTTERKRKQGLRDVYDRRRRDQCLFLETRMRSLLQNPIS
uniref:Uncharacterized protein n=1 Tax=viral metagenome TaxID=1070528 RepID=A0A6C0CC47_9ZZZZ